MSGRSVENRVGGISGLVTLLRQKRASEVQTQDESQDEATELALPVINWAEQNARVAQQDSLRHLFFDTIRKSFPLAEVKCGSQHVPQNEVFPIEFEADNIDRAKAVKALIQTQFAAAVMTRVVEVKISCDKRNPKAKHQFVMIYVKDYQSFNLESAKVQ